MYAKSISTNFVKSGKSDAGTRNKNQDEFMAKMVYVYICNLYIDIYINMFMIVYVCVSHCRTSLSSVGSKVSLLGGPYPWSGAAF